MFCSLLTRSTISCACHARRHLSLQKWSEPLVLLTFWLQNVLHATTACTFSRSELPKVVRTPSVFNILTSKCASRHNGVHFFDISTSKSRPTLRCFVHFDFQMCFSPQRRALFRHLNFQKSSDAEVFCRHGGRICPWTMLGRICPWMKWDEVGSGANVTLIQGRMWPLLLRGTRNSFRASKGFFSTLESHIHVLCDVPTAIWINFQDDMDSTVYLCYVVTSISSNFEDALDVTFQEPFQSTSRTLWMLGCKIHFEHLRRRFGCYTLTVISFNFPDALDATW